MLLDDYTHSSLSLAKALNEDTRSIRRRIKLLSKINVFVFNRKAVIGKFTVHFYTFNQSVMARQLERYQPKSTSDKLTEVKSTSDKLAVINNNTTVSNKISTKNIISTTSDKLTEVKSTPLVTSEPIFDWASFNDGFFKPSVEEQRIKDMPNTKPKKKDFDDISPKKLDRILNM